MTNPTTSASKDGGAGAALTSARERTWERALERLAVAYRRVLGPAPRADHKSDPRSPFAAFEREVGDPPSEPAPVERLVA